MSTATHKSPEAVFSVDVEDYFQVTAFERDIPRSNWDDYAGRVVANTQRILEILASFDVRGTFFVLGWTAERYPELVREIHRAGHEIGSHSYWHNQIFKQSPQEFRADLRRSREVLSEIIGEPVVAYRAPTFSITERSWWALEILVEEGFEFDSSIFPIHHDRYGVPGARRELHLLDTSAGQIWEFPPTIATVAKWNVPVAGGGYFRLYPYALTRKWIRLSQNQRPGPFMFYIHPWEVDPEQPRLKVGSRLSRFRHYVNLGSTVEKINCLLSDFRFGPLREVASQYPSSPVQSA